jgi:hypothetical protein
VWGESVASRQAGSRLVTLADDWASYLGPIYLGAITFECSGGADRVEPDGVGDGISQTVVRTPTTRNIAFSESGTRAPMNANMLT